MRAELGSAGKRLVKQEQIIMALIVHGKEFGICREVCEKALLKKIKQGNEMILSLEKNSYLVIVRE